jgi:hypothetical protein
MEKSLDNHYTEMGIEPIVYSDANDLDPYQHTIIKYVTRWRSKGGLRDLKAAQLLIQKYIDKEEVLTFDEVRALKELVRQIPNGKYDRIVTVGRGGMWAAANLAYALDIHQVETMQLRDINQLTADNILFVDGIADTGKTLQSIMIDSACLLCRASTATFPTYAGQLVNEAGYIKMGISQTFDKEQKCTQ